MRPPARPGAIIPRVSEESRSAKAMLAEARALCGFAGRRPGTDAERRAADHLRDRLRALGRPVEIEASYVHPQWAVIVAAHCLLGFAGSIISATIPVAGFALVLLAAASLYLDLNTRFYLLRRLFFRRGSQNVVSRGPWPDAPARLLLLAHYDAAKSGLIFSSSLVGRLARFADWLGIGLPRVPFWSLAALLPLLGARMAGAESDVLGGLQLLPTLALLIATALLIDVELSRPVPGANDNASGVAVTLALARTLRSKPPANLDVWVVFTGGHECLMEGTRAFFARHRRELDRASTYVLSIDAVGAGPLRVVVSEGIAVPYEMDRRLVELAAELATPGADEPPIATQLRSSLAGDALAARIRGLPALGLTTVAPGELTPANYHLHADDPASLQPAAMVRARDFALALVRALDRELGSGDPTQRAGSRRKRRSRRRRRRAAKPDDRG